MGVNGLIKRVLTEVGLDSARYNLQWASAAEAPRFVKLITEFTAKIKELGPLGAAEGMSPEEAKAKAELALKMVNDRKVRIGFGNLSKELRKEVPGLTEQTVAAAVEEKLAKNLANLSAA